MPDDDRPLPFEVADDRKDIAHIGVDRVVLARAPTGFAEAALVEGGDLAVGGECFTDADPVVGVEVIGAVHEQDGRAPARAEGAVENRYVAGIHPSIALHDASPVRFEPFMPSLVLPRPTLTSMARAGGNFLHRRGRRWEVVAQPSA